MAPGWATLLVMAEEWGVAPWVLEDELSCVWADRWAALQESRSRARAGPRQVGGAKAGNRRRLI